MPVASVCEWPRGRGPNLPNCMRRLRAGVSRRVRGAPNVSVCTSIVCARIACRLCAPLVRCGRIAQIARKSSDPLRASWNVGPSEIPSAPECCSLLFAMCSRVGTRDTDRDSDSEFGVGGGGRRSAQEQCAAPLVPL